MARVLKRDGSQKCKRVKQLTQVEYSFSEANSYEYEMSHEGYLDDSNDTSDNTSKSSDGSNSCSDEEPFTMEPPQKPPQKRLIDQNHQIIEPPTWLPNGWFAAIKISKKGLKIKYYADPISQRRFYSKPQVENFLKIGGSDIDEGKLALVTQDFNKDKASLPVICTLECPTWLPKGWKVVLQTSTKGLKTRKKKYYVDPISKRRFYSKPQVQNFLKIGESNIDEGKLAIVTQVKDCLQIEKSYGYKQNLAQETKAFREDMGVLQSTSSTDPESSQEAKLDDDSDDFGDKPAEATQIQQVKPPAWLPDSCFAVMMTKETGGKMKKWFVHKATGRRFGSRVELICFLQTGKTYSSYKRSHSEGFKLPGASKKKVSKCSTTKSTNTIDEAQDNLTFEEMICDDEEFLWSEVELQIYCPEEIPLCGTDEKS